MEMVANRRRVVWHTRGGGRQSGNTNNGRRVTRTREPNRMRKTRRNKNNSNNNNDNDNRTGLEGNRRRGRSRCKRPRCRAGRGSCPSPRDGEPATWPCTRRRACWAWPAASCTTCCWSGAIIGVTSTTRCWWYTNGPGTSTSRRSPTTTCGTTSVIVATRSSSRWAWPSSRPLRWPCPWCSAAAVPTRPNTITRCTSGSYSIAVRRSRQQPTRAAPSCFRVRADDARATAFPRAYFNISQARGTSASQR